MVNQYPVVEFSADVLSSCLPLETTFTSVISPSSGSCLWDLGDGTLSTTCNNVSHIYVDSGCYDISLQVTSTEGCITIVDKSQYVCARDIPIPIFDWDPDTSTMMNTYIEFYNSSIDATSYEWQLDVNGNLYLCNLAPIIEKTFNIMGLTKYCKTFKSQSEAIEELS